MIGNILIVIALIASVFSLWMYNYSLRGYKNTLNYARLGYFISSAFVVLASAFLMYLIILHKYEYRYVYEFSGTGLSWGLLFSTFYAGQEGSFLLWVLFAAIIGIILQNSLKKDEEYEIPVMLIYNGILTFLLIMVCPALKSPFQYIWSDPLFVDSININPDLLSSLPFLKSFVFMDEKNGKAFVKISSELVSLLQSNNIKLEEFIIQGKGLNPLLQNFWMQIHPPVLFIGFALAGVPFSFAIAALIKNDFNGWIKKTMVWNHIGALVLGAAIMLGGYWAYGILGWGGYWGWDPVENASLVPWIIWVAVIHTSLIQIKEQRENNNVLIKTNILLTAFVFSFIIYSTFLTRSGLLSESSVHSFVEPGRFVFIFLLIFLIISFLLPIVLLIIKKKSLTTLSPLKPVLNKEYTLFIGAAVLLASALVVTVGTSFPLIGGAVETDFYNKMNYPIAIAIVLLNGFSIYTGWSIFDLKTLIKKTKNAVIVALIITVSIIVITDYFFIPYILLMFGSVLTISLNTVYMVSQYRSRLYWGGLISHIGLGTFFIGVLSAGYFSTSRHVDLKLNEPQKILGHNLVYKGYKVDGFTEKYYFEVEIEKAGGIRILNPVLYVSNYNNGLMREPALANGIIQDLYISPVSFVSAEEQKRGTEISLSKGEETVSNGIKIKFESYYFPEETMSLMQQGKEFNIGINLDVTKDGKTYKASPRMKTNGRNNEYIPYEIKEAGLVFTIGNLNAGGAVSFSMRNIKDTKIYKDILSVEFSVKPFMTFVWLGVLLIVIGFLLSAIKSKMKLYKQ